jgi:hypothetical protein
MTAGIELKSKDIEELKGIISSIKQILNEHPELDNKLKLSDKFLGPLGEATGLARIMQGKNAQCSWHGKFKKDYDVSVTENGKKVKYQIKSSSDQDHFLFRVLEVQFDRSELPKVIEKLRNKNPEPVLEGIEKAVQKSQADFWLLVYLKKAGTEFFKLDKEAMKSVAKQHYSNYYHHTPHRKNTNYAVNQTSGKYVVMLSGKRAGDPELLNKYKV